MLSNNCIKSHSKPVAHLPFKNSSSLNILVKQQTFWENFCDFIAHFLLDLHWMNIFLGVMMVYEIFFFKFSNLHYLMIHFTPSNLMIKDSSFNVLYVTRLCIVFWTNWFGFFHVAAVCHTFKAAENVLRNEIHDCGNCNEVAWILSSGFSERAPGLLVSFAILDPNPWGNLALLISLWDNRLGWHKILDCFVDIRARSWDIWDSSLQPSAISRGMGSQKWILRKIFI